jgi:octaprenyl-diphosphate synthase
MDAAGLAPFLERTETRLAEAIERPEGIPGILADAAQHLCIGGAAKRLRPRLVYLFGQAAAAPADGLVDLGVAAELVHAASLLHDDVVDNGQLRRDRPTANARWSNIVAVLAGDWVLSRALVLLQKYPPVITAKAVEVVAQMTGAAMREVEVRGDATLTLSGWRAIAEGKTGTLFAWCGEAAALLANDPAAGARFARFGMHLGVAFQMADDLKDLFGGDPGKDRYSDIRNRTPSMPIVLALEHSPKWKSELARAWDRGAMTQEEAAELGEALIASGAADTAVDALDREVALAFEALGPDRNQPWGLEMQRLADAFCASLRRPTSPSTAPSHKEEGARL